MPSRIASQVGGDFHWQPYTFDNPEPKSHSFVCVYVCQLKMVGFLESFFLPGNMDWGKLRSKNKKEWNQWLAILTKKAWSKRICLPFFLSKLTLQGFLSNEHNIYFIFLSGEATTSCKNVETRWKTGLSLLQIAASCTSVIYNTDRPSPPLPFPFIKSCSTKYGLVLLATLIRGGGGITSTRSWTGHLSKNEGQCLK